MFEGLVNRPGLPIHTPFHLACVCHSRIKQLVVSVSQNRIFSSFFMLPEVPIQTVLIPRRQNHHLQDCVYVQYYSLYSYVFCYKRKVCRVSALLGTSSYVVRIEFSAFF